MNLTITKKQIKRTAAIALGAVAAGAVAVTAILTSVGTKAAERRLPIYSVDRGDKKIAITFDCAWENSNTNALIDILDEYDARGTFFVTGDWCDRYPEDVKKFHDAGHEVENHSDQHPHVAGMNVNDLINDTKECSRKIEMITGEAPRLYRAPYGEFDDSLITTLEGMGMKVIQWDVDSVDWKKPSAEEIKKKVLGKVKSGSILLFHNDLDNTTAALPEILRSLKADGYELVGVEDMIYFDNYTINSDGTQVPVSESLIEFSDEKIEAVMKQYSGQIAASGVTEEQLSAAVAAIKSGDISSLPDEIKPIAAQVLAKINAADTDSSQAQDNEESVPADNPAK